MKAFAERSSQWRLQCAVNVVLGLGVDIVAKGGRVVVVVVLSSDLVRWLGDDGSVVVPLEMVAVDKKIVEVVVVVDLVVRAVVVVTIGDQLWAAKGYILGC
ncbi:Hypothetical predicted protein [Olea europaea subsp. europaea]|uniref:Uncharacterized protein n=1 Tax=Olea europaea subsp. europaea TaxID=158383 RepID=A0A8S0V2H7_OLEEU|nr:Hypothetical predicted protein [Olea europaea subsp. europaea]